MSEKLKAIMLHLVDVEKLRVESRLSAYADILIKSADHGGFVQTITIEGIDEPELQQNRRLIGDLCKVGLVTTDTHYTHRNAQIVAHITPLGLQVVDEMKRSE